MKPAHTKYRLARPGGEYNRLYALMQREMGIREPLGWPVVVAERDGRVVGFLGTAARDDVLIAGPLVIEGGRNPIMFLHLTEAYENVLRLASINSYYFTVDEGNFEQVARVKSLGIPQVGQDKNKLIFLRELKWLVAAGQHK